MRVPINKEGVDYEGRQLVFATPDGFVTPQRLSGSHTIRARATANSFKPPNPALQVRTLVQRNSDGDKDKDKDRGRGRQMEGEGEEGFY